MPHHAPQPQLPPDPVAVHPAFDSRLARNENDVMCQLNKSIVTLGLLLIVQSRNVVQN